MSIINQVSHTFGEYLLLPGYTSLQCTPKKVKLKTPLVRYNRNDNVTMMLNIPIVSSIMQAVSNDKLAISLAKEGGLAFIFCSQSIEEEVNMIKNVKKYKAGFVESDANLTMDHCLKDILELKEKTNHSTIAVTSDGTKNGKLLGLVTSKDYRVSRIPLETKVKDIMMPIEKLVCSKDGISLREANDIIWNKKISVLPIIDEQQYLRTLVFRKDYEEHKCNEFELLDEQKRYRVGAGINTHDYQERIPALVEAGADILCIDSSEGYTEWQKRTIEFVKKNYKDVKIGAGNVVNKEGFMFLAEAGADFVKVGIGGGSICITREQKGIGRGQATAVLEVAQARNEYYQKTGIYIPICSDGGIVHDYHITLALAMGADFVMLGRYFARFDESPTAKVNINGVYMKEYWGEGSNRARNWQRYDSGDNNCLVFEEGVDSYVPYAGSLKDNIRMTLSKIKSTMCNCGVTNLEDLKNNIDITLVSQTSIIEGGAHDVQVKNR